MNTQIDNSCLYPNLASISHALLQGNHQLEWMTDPKVQKVAVQLLNYGEYLKYAKYAKYIPGTPDILHNKALYWIGDTCALVRSGLDIKARVDHILSSNVPPEEKLKDMMEVAQLTLTISNTQFVEYLPKSVKTNIKWLHDACGVVRLGCVVKEKMDGVTRLEDSSLAKTGETLEATRLAVWTAHSALNLLSSTDLSALKASLYVGYGTLTAAKTGISALNFINNLVAPAA